MQNKGREIAIIVVASVIGLPLMALFSNEPCIAQFVAVIYGIMLFIVAKKTNIGRLFVSKLSDSIEALLPDTEIQ